MSKPYIKKSHKIIEIVSYVILWASIIIAIIGAVTLPDKIATHYNGAGEVDGYGSPATLLFLPIIMLVCNLSCSLILHFLPSNMWNTPSKVKPGREMAVFSVMSCMMVWMEAEISLFTLYATIISYRELGSLIMPGVVVFMIAILATTAYGIIGFYKKNK